MHKWSIRQQRNALSFKSLLPLLKLSAVHNKSDKETYSFWEICDLPDLDLVLRDEMSKDTGGNKSEIK